MTHLDLLLKNLNEGQRQAVTAPRSHLLINAAAGTGKTTTLAARILYLQIADGIMPKGILALSFSRAARANLIERIRELCFHIGAGNLIPVYTFHGLAWKIIKTATDKGSKHTFLRPGFEVARSVSGMSEVWNRHGKDLLEGINDQFSLDDRGWIYASALNHVRQGHPDIAGMVMKPNEIPPDQSLVVGDGHRRAYGVLGKNVQVVWQRYNSFLRRYNLIDYPGMICEAAGVLANDGAVREILFGNLRHLMIDEYQDTSRVQEKLAFLIADSKVPMTVVGDNDQTIYAFNGSDVSNILNFTKRVGATGVSVAGTVNLGENYRSTDNILRLANRITGASRDPDRPGKKLVSGLVTDGPGMNVELVLAPTLDLAADFVADRINLLVKSGINPDDIAVLVRKDTEFYPQGEKVRQALANRGIEAGSIQEQADRVARATSIALQICQDNYMMPIAELLDLLDNPTSLGIEDGDEATVRRLIDDAATAGAEYGFEASSLLADPGSAPGNMGGKVGIHTIHSAKGQEYRIVFCLYLGDRQFPSGVSPDAEEERRILYVAITRAREQLYIIGKVGASPDLFDECRGEGVQELNWLVCGGAVDFSSEALDPQTQREIDRARDYQKREEERLKEEMRRMFEEE